MEFNLCDWYFVGSLTYREATLAYSAFLKDVVLLL